MGFGFRTERAQYALHHHAPWSQVVTRVRRDYLRAVFCDAPSNTAPHAGRARDAVHGFAPWCGHSLAEGCARHARHLCSRSRQADGRKVSWRDRQHVDGGQQSGGNEVTRGRGVVDGQRRCRGTVYFADAPLSAADFIPGAPAFLDIVRDCDINYFSISGAGGAQADVPVSVDPSANPDHCRHTAVSSAQSSPFTPPASSLVRTRTANDTHRSSGWHGPQRVCHMRYRAKLCTDMDETLSVVVRHPV